MQKQQAGRTGYLDPLVRYLNRHKNGCPLGLHLRPPAPWLPPWAEQRTLCSTTSTRRCFKEPTPAISNPIILTFSCPLTTILASVIETSHLSLFSHFGSMGSLRFGRAKTGVIWPVVSTVTCLGDRHAERLGNK